VIGERPSVGLDVHARSVVAAALDGVTGEVWQRRLTPDPDEVLGWLRSMPGPVRVTYRGGADGFRVGPVPGPRRGWSVWSLPRRSLQRPSGDRQQA